MSRNIFLKTPKIGLTNKAFRKIYEGPGVYCFLMEDGPIYIGKAINLKNRLTNYLQNNLEAKTKKMVSSADFVTYIKVSSDLEALLLEAELIRKYQPLYNTASKDDKRALYIRITKEKYPRVVTCRKIETLKKDTTVFFGPFPSSTNVRLVLRQIRRIFPYADHKAGKRPCLLSQIGLCAPCPNLIETIAEGKGKNQLLSEYRANIRMIVKILQRKNGLAKNELIKKMRTAARSELFEDALRYREQLKRLEYISQDITDSHGYVENPNLLEDIHQKELIAIRSLIFKKSGLNVQTNRIECFDVAHLSGFSGAASMVTFINGEPAKEYYRHLKIRRAKPGDDLEALKEIAEVRALHLKDWGRPDLIIVDGGKGQVNIFQSVYGQHNIPVVGLAKRYESLVIPVCNRLKGSYIMSRVPAGAALNLLQRIRNEAHRFAQRYHHQLLRKSLLS
jgi:excinuclease ABC subunit C